MKILGISAFYHDSAAALVVDGEIVAAAQEERFTRIKHDQCFPAHAVDYCLEAAGLEAGELDYVGFDGRTMADFGRALERKHGAEYAQRALAAERLHGAIEHGQCAEWTFEAHIQAYLNDHLLLDRRKRL